jgi:hypothetical protein
MKGGFYQLFKEVILIDETQNKGSFSVRGKNIWKLSFQLPMVVKGSSHHWDSSEKDNLKRFSISISPEGVRIFGNPLSENDHPISPKGL